MIIAVAIQILQTKEINYKLELLLGLNWITRNTETFTVFQVWTQPGVIENTREIAILPSHFSLPQ